MKLFLLTCLLLPVSSLFAQLSTASLDLGRHSIDYVVSFPEGYAKSDTTWPLVLFLHGGGDSGQPVENLLEDPIIKRIAENKDGEYPFVLVAPRNPYVAGFWDHVSLGYLVDDIIAGNRIDTSRVYLTGLSRGGYGAWTLAMHQPDRFAALAPVCGAIPHPYHVWIPDNLPIWVFHGAEDGAIPTSESVDMMEILRRKDRSPKAKITVYEGVAHNAWDYAYADPELYRWLLAQRKTSQP